MCDGYHICPICTKKHKCDVKWGHDAQFIASGCDDGESSFCTPCQMNRMDEIDLYLKKNGRI